MKIEIGKEYIYNNELDNNNGIKIRRGFENYNNDKCKVDDIYKDTGFIFVTFECGTSFIVYPKSLTPIPEIVPPQGGTGKVSPVIGIMGVGKVNMSQQLMHIQQIRKSETSCETCEDHDSHDCAICTKNDDAKYKRAWEALPGAIQGKVHPITLNIIIKTMVQVIDNE